MYHISIHTYYYYIRFEVILLFKELVCVLNALRILPLQYRNFNFGQ